MPTYDFRTYVEGVAATKVPGVTKDFGMEPPQSLSTPMLPAKFLRVPKSTRERFAFCVEGADMHGSGMMTVEVIIIIEPVAQALPEPNFTAAVDMSDNLTKAFKDADIANSWPTMTTRVQEFTVAGHNYWALVAEVTARG